MDGPTRRAISEDDARALLEAVAAAGIGAMTVALDGSVRTANRAAGRLLGVDMRHSETLVGLGRRLDAVGPDGSPWTFDAATSSAKGADAHLDGAVIGFRRTTGTLDWLSVTTRPVVGASDEPVAMLVLLARLSGLPGRAPSDGGVVEARFRDGFDGAPIGMAIVDQHGQIVRANAALARMRGRSQADLVGANWDDGLHPEDAAVAIEFINRMRAGELPSFSVVYRYRRADGTEGTALGSSNIVDDRSGEGPQYFCQMVDVTEQRRAEADLEAREQRFRQLALTVPVGIYELDANGLVTFVTPRWSEITGRAAETAIGRSVLEGVAHEDREDAERAFDAACRGNREWQAAYRYLRPDGDVRDVLAQAVPIRGPDGALAGWLGAITDLSPGREMEDALRRQAQAYSELAAQREEERAAAQRAEAHRFESIGRLAGGVAHDFNNLLGVISNYATFLARSPELPTTLASDVAQITLAAQRGADLTRQLLLFSRRDELRRQRFDVGELLGSLASLVTRPLAPVVDLEVSTEPGMELVADRGQLEQLLLNLLLNARDAIAASSGHGLAPARGHVVLGAAPLHLAAGDARLGHLPAGRYALITVADDGPGMSSETLANAFQPFFTTRHRPDASGLGLATVQGIAERAGGRVWIDSSPGSGTTVSVLLPLPPLTDDDARS